MKKTRFLTEEKAIEQMTSLSEYFNLKREDFDKIALSIANRRKDTVLNIRVNSRDLKRIKSKAQKMGVKYQTLISEVLHRIAADEIYDTNHCSPKNSSQE